MATIDGVSQLVSTLGRLAKVYDTPDAVQAGSWELVKQQRANVRRKLNRNARGVLENAIVTTVIDSRTAEAGVPANRIIYAHVHEFGRTIVPRKAKALRFVIDGEVIFARSVRIPARPYIRPSIRQAQKRMVRAVIRMTNKSIREAINGQ